MCNTLFTKRRHRFDPLVTLSPGTVLLRTSFISLFLQFVWYESKNFYLTINFIDGEFSFERCAIKWCQSCSKKWRSSIGPRCGSFALWVSDESDAEFLWKHFRRNLRCSWLKIFCVGVNSFIVVPEELPSILSIFYSNVPPIKKGLFV